MKKHHHLSLLALLGALAIAASCSQNFSYQPGTGSEVAIAAISGSGNASESLIANNSTDLTKGESSRIARLKNELGLFSKAWAVPSCDWNSLITGCINNSTTLTFDHCSTRFDPAIAISGSESFTWNEASCCTIRPLEASSLTPCSYNRRTVNTNGDADPLKRSVGSNAITLNTEDISGYAQPKTGGFTVSCQGYGNNTTCSGQRQITITGAHYTGQSGRDQWDHTVSTDEPIVIQGYDGGRKVLRGTVRVQHNIAQFTTITSIEAPLTHRAGCCLPVGGKVKTAFIGGRHDGKTEEMTFGPGCGEAKINDMNRKASGLRLHHCL